jgi:hypothetical protein
MKMVARPSAPSNMPATLSGVSARSPRNIAASTAAISGDSPNSTEISPECT